MLIITSSGLLAQPLDPEPAAALKAPAPQMPPPPVRNNWQGLRAFPDTLCPLLGRQAAIYPGVVVTPHACLAADGNPIALRWYAPSMPPTGAAVVYAHGGGRLAGSLDQHDCLLRRYAAETGVPFLAVDYRLAPPEQGATQADEVLAAYTWLQNRAAEFCINPARCALMGDSGGGRIAVGATILARQRQVPIARQLLVCTLLDDRNQTPAPALAPSASWAGDNDHPGRAALPNEQVGRPPVSLVAAPARLREPAPHVHGSGQPGCFP